MTSTSMSLTASCRPRRGAVQISLVDSVDFLKRLRNQRHSANRFRNDTAHLFEQGIGPVQLKILLPPAHFRPKQPLAL